MILPCLTMIGIGAVLASSIDSRWQLYFVYGVIIGLLGYAFIYGPLSINVMRWFEHRRGFAVGPVTAGEGTGGTIWPPVFQYFNETAGWRDTFLWFGVFVLVTALLISVVLWPRMPTRDARTRDDGGRIVDSHAEAFTIRKRAIGLSTFAPQTAICLAIVGCCVSMAMPVAHLVAHASGLGHATARAAEMLAVAFPDIQVLNLHELVDY